MASSDYFVQIVSASSRLVDDDRTSPMQSRVERYGVNHPSELVLRQREGGHLFRRIVDECFRPAKLRRLVASDPAECATRYF
jgi:hypothetical protein